MLSRFYKKGFTLAEVLVGTAVFLIVAIGVYNAYVSLFRITNVNQGRLLAIALADEQFEIVRNMPYVNVGLTTGIPLGVLPQTQSYSRGGFTFNVTRVIRNLDLSTSTFQASSKLVEIDVDCPLCQNFTQVALTGEVSPANLSSASTGGALVIQVFDSNGVPIQGATVVVQSTATSSVTNTDITGNDGTLSIVGVPAGTNVYRITVTKSGYSTSRTYPLGGAGNPTPTVPDATVIQGQVTQVSLSIDKISTLTFSSVSPLCAPVGNFDFDLVGTKTIGTNVAKYSASMATDNNGNLLLNPMEWDTYTLTPTDTAYDLNGMTPFSPVALVAGSNQTVQLVVVPRNTRSLMVAVQDSVTKLPISDATVQLTSGGYSETLLTGQGSISQTDWSGGSGQSNFSNVSQYYFDNGLVDTSTTTGSILLKQTFGNYSTVASGTLQSSTFDTGTTSNFYSLSWKPSNQPTLAGPMPVKFQVATNPTSGGTWNYLGPDGTANTYFTAPGMQISSANNGKQFLRYQTFLSTQTATITPSVTDVSFTYTSGCTPPGQVIFQGLSAGSYTLSISKSGYTTSVIPVTISTNWQSQTVNLAP